MRISYSLFFAAAAASIVACGETASNTVDARGNNNTADASTQPDADPDMPDAAPVTGNFACLGMPIPTTAPDPVVVTGSAMSVSSSGATPAAGLQVQAFRAGSAEPIATATSAAGTGAYTLNIPSGGVPVDGYLLTDGGNTYLDNYLYPPTPLFANSPAASFMVSPSTLDLLFLLLGVQNDPTKGIVVVRVTDCNGAPVANATVTVAGATRIFYTQPGGNLPGRNTTMTAADGQAYATGVTASAAVVVDANAGGMSLREHTINVRAGALTTTLVVP